MKLPVLLSVPHAGLEVPPELRERNRLTEREIAEDGDEGAREIYDLSEEVEVFLTTPIARAFVDLNRAEDDRRKDGVVKTHTCWDVPIYDRPLEEPLVERLLERYHRAYHHELTRLAKTGVRFAVDCHTMAAAGPPVGPDPGKPRPAACIGTGIGTFPMDWLDRFASALREGFGDSVTIDEPFSGGWITRSHGPELPWIQLELSRSPERSNAEKRDAVLHAIRAVGTSPRQKSDS